MRTAFAVGLVDGARARRHYWRWCRRGDVSVLVLGFVGVAALREEATAPNHCSIIDTSGSVRGVGVV